MGVDIPEGYVMDSKERLVPEHMVKEQDQLMDQTVRKILAYAEDLNAQIARFKGHTFDDVAEFSDLLAEKYGAKRGGAKGNVTLTTYDGCQKVVIQVSENLEFGPELQIAKSLFDECISDWAAGTNDKIRALVDHAFQVDQEGRINRSRIFELRRLDLDDARWKSAVEALNNSIFVAGSKEYCRFYKRNNPRGAWKAVTIDLASAVAPASPAPGC